jgi:diguanylate cyclase
MGELGPPKKRLRRLLVIVLAATAVHALGLLEFIERPLQDLRFQIVQRRARQDVVVVALDSKSMRSLEAWPGLRSLYAAALHGLVRAGARSIALVADLTAPSTQKEDQALEVALDVAGGDVVLPAIQIPDPAGSTGNGGAVLPPLPLFRARSVLASSAVAPDGDGLIRRYPMQHEFAGKATPSVAAAMFGIVSPSRRSFYVDLGIRPDSVVQISLADVVSGRFDPSRVARKAVIVGVTAPEMAGAVAVAPGRSLPPVIVHALALESLARGRALYRTGSLVVFLVALAFGWLLYVPLVRSSLGKGLAMALAVSVGLFATSAVVQAVFPVILDVSPWILVTFGLYGLTLIRRSEQRTAQIRLAGARARRAERVMAHVVANSFDAVIVVAEDGKIAEFNGAAERMFEYPASAAVGVCAADLIRPAGEEPDSAPATDLFVPGTGVREAVGWRRDGSQFPVELRVSEFIGDSGRSRVGILRDITERKTHERALEHQARHDSLTGLPNRVMLRERVVQALNHAQRHGSTVAFLILDLDRFKEINDTLGHHVGDMLLQQIGERLGGALRQSDTIARMGGDEFAALLPGADAATAREIAKRLIASLAQPFEVQGLSLQVEASVGIAMFPADGKDASDVIQRADVAMYVAKRKRIGIAVYEMGQDYNSVRHLTLNGELRKAIDEGHLILYYQPKISAATGKIVGAEALVRWQHPLFGMIPPDDFIALAEHSGLIKPLSRWVLREGMRQAALWRRKGFPISLAVNVSARNVAEKGMPKEIAALLESNGLPPELLICEITESVIMEDRKRSLEVVSELVGLGVSISIDDFGTGYSSLAYLRQLPATEIKIDKSFVMRMDRDKDNAVIVSSTIQMAHNLGLKVVAEGVESERIWSDLLALGCDYGQGYLFSRPVPPEEFADLLEASADTPGFLPLASIAEPAMREEQGALRD